MGLWARGKRHLGCLESCDGFWVLSFHHCSPGPLSTHVPAPRCTSEPLACPPDCCPSPKPPQASPLPCSWLPPLLHRSWLRKAEPSPFPSALEQRLIFPGGLQPPRACLSVLPRPGLRGVPEATATAPVQPLPQQGCVIWAQVAPAVQPGKLGSSQPLWPGHPWTPQLLHRLPHPAALAGLPAAQGHLSRRGGEKEAGGCLQLHSASQPREDWHPRLKGHQEAAVGRAVPLKAALLPLLSLATCRPRAAQALCKPGSEECFGGGGPLCQLGGKSPSRTGGEVGSGAGSDSPLH